MTESFNNEQVIDLLTEMLNSLNRLERIEEENFKVLKAVDWKLWEIYKITKSVAHDQNIEVFEPSELDRIVR
jgi:hypothetical protein